MVKSESSCMYFEIYFERTHTTEKMTFKLGFSLPTFWQK
jgi:hypothetical protein